MKRILIVGSWGTTHVRRFLRILCENKENLIIDSFDPTFDHSRVNECGVDNVYRLEASAFSQRIYKIRKIGTLLCERHTVNTFDHILSNNHYDLVNIHFLPANTEQYVKVAHKHRVKIMLTPLGSDVLRVKKIFIPTLKRAFVEADYVSGNIVTGFCQQVKKMFSVPDNKIKNLGYGSETISSIIEMKGKFSKQQMCEMLSIPFSPYYICCGYTASLAQHHDIMIDAIAKNKDLLPEGTRLIIPLSYGPAKEALKKSVAKQCEQYGLPYTLLTEYMTVEQVACLRFVSNLFIHIQPTDAYNASLQEFLIADTEVINGKWLPYPSLEEHGIPYHILSSIDDLPREIEKILSHEGLRPQLSKEAEDEIIGNAWNKKIKDWVDAYKTI